MERKTLAAFAVGVLAVLVIAILAVGYSSRYSKDEVKAQLEAQQVKSQKELDDFATQTEQKLAEIEQKQAADLAVLKAQEDAKAVALEEAQAKIAELEKTAAEVPIVTPPASVGETKLYDKLKLGDVVKFDVDNGDLSGLFDGTITFNDELYDVEERIVTTGTDMYVDFSAVGDEELGAQPYVALDAREAIAYRYEFKDSIDMTQISDDEPLTLKFLGKEVEVVKASASGVTFRSGQTFYLKEGDSVTVDEKKVVLEFVGDNGRAGVSVDGVSKVITEFRSEQINGVDVRVEDILVNSRAGSAVLVVGSKVLEDQKSGDYFFDNKDYKFRVESSGGQLKALVVTYNVERNDITDSDAKTKPLALGDEVVFGDNFAAVKFEKVYNADYKTVDVELTRFREELFDGTDVDKLVARVSADSKIFEIASDETDEVFIAGDNKVYYADSKGDWHESTTASLKIVNEDYEVLVAFNGGGQLVFTLPTPGENVVLDTKLADKKFGLLKDDAEGTDIVYSTKNVGTKDFDVLGVSGVVIRSPDNKAGQDEFSMDIPSDIVEVGVAVYLK